MTPSNLLMIIRQQVYVGIIAFGLTVVMLTGNIDLSVGNMLTFLCCICATIMIKTNNVVLGLVGTVAVGALCGLFNGVLVSYVKLNSFITTLGASSIYSALALMLSAGTILVIDTNSSKAFQNLGKASFLGGTVHILIVWFIVVAVVLGLLLSRTVYGQQIYAIGANPVAARYSGIHYQRNITIAYVITGLCVGFAAVVMMANSLSSNPQAASGKEMEVILCVVLGGCAINGGKGSVWGTIIGVLFYGVLSAGFTALALSQHIQWVIMGAIMLVALSLDVLKGKGVKLWKKK
jgi:ribose/xylose/arabinose/galactoside ABC-type transport system permease subunit